jgi:enamine deaminase RidA (YjgF/YER057c/UK114 family)
LLQRQWAGETRAAREGTPVLAQVHFGRPLDDPADDDATPTLNVHVPLDLIAGERQCVDVLRAAGPVRFERAGDVTLATDDRLLFGSVRIDERDAHGLRAAAHRAYTSIFALLDRSPCRFPLRFWNYVPHINAPLDGLERYRHFNVGRQEAFLAAQRAAFAGAPAACAIGSFSDALAVYFVAAAQAPIPIENPRQISAYHYPADYGPRSPTFSRATLYPRDLPALFISGTASIVGHRSEHPGDPLAQTRETFVNLRAVVEGANTRLSKPVFALDALTYTVYVRRSADLDVIRTQFLREVGEQSAAARSALFLRGDICRAELLVEIEATGRIG